MPPLPPPNVLILAQESQAASQWARSLMDAGACVWLSAADVPPNATADVAITDLPSLECVAAAAGSAFPGSACQSQPPRTVGLISVGPADWADVSLAADFAPGELVVACRLLAEVSRLRAERARFAQVQDETQRLANTDPLTGLPNRRAWDSQLPLKRRLARTVGGTLWLAIVDFDGFKGVNDASGLSAGDDVLRNAAGAMAGALRRDDVIARLGGDEFGVLLVGADAAGAQRVFDRLCSAVTGTSLPAGARRLTASIGYASLEAADAADERAEKELFAAAERALREAKRAGGNRACGDVERC